MNLIPGWNMNKHEEDQIFPQIVSLIRAIFSTAGAESAVATGPCFFLAGQLRPIWCMQRPQTRKFFQKAHCNGQAMHHPMKTVVP